MIRSRAIELHERCEVGVLEFTDKNIVDGPEIDFDLPAAFQTDFSILKCVVIESGHTVEAGIVFRGNDGQEICIFAGVSPYTVTLSGIVSNNLKFDPEYDIGNYARTPMI